MVFGILNFCFDYGVIKFSLLRLKMFCFDRFFNQLIYEPFMRNLWTLPDYYLGLYLLHFWSYIFWSYLSKFHLSISTRHALNSVSTRFYTEYYLTRNLPNWHFWYVFRNSQPNHVSRQFTQKIVLHVTVFCRWITTAAYIFKI